MFLAKMLALFNVLVVAASGSIIMDLTAEEWSRRSALLKQAQDAPREQSSCSVDYRSTMPACHQFEVEWCWATGVASLTIHYKNLISEYPTCAGLECQVVQGIDTHTGAKCCPHLSTPSYPCAGDSLALARLAPQATNWTGVPHRLIGSVLNQTALDTALARGPILLLIGDRSYPSHVCTLHGCGSGLYYYHNPFNVFGNFTYYTYNELIHNYDSYGMHWIDTVVHA